MKSPDKIIPPEPRNHGGKREHCPSCGSDNLLEEKRIICTDCGEVISTIHRLVNPDDPTGGQDESRSSRGEVAALQLSAACSDSPPISIPKDNSSPFIKPIEPTDNLTAGEEEKPTSPPAALAVSIASVDAPGSTIGEIETHAAHLLLAISGDCNEHIEMSSRGAKKYITVQRPLTLTDMKQHLQGTKTKGATLARRDGTTRALCFDADDQQTWQLLNEASTLLIAQGFKPILEPSPAGRGGHLWLIFNDLVNASQAYTQVRDIAPMLKALTEYWPRPGNQKVRLPAGRYVSATLSRWCDLVDHTGQELAGRDRPRIMQLLLSNQTSAELIQKDPFPLEESPVNRQQVSTHRSGKPTEPTGGVDEAWLQKYARSNYWFAWTPAQLAAWYNERTALSDLLPPERNGHGLASWRGERTPSVAYTKDGVGWVDFGASARRNDGKCDGGDSLELAARIQQRSKVDIMREAGSELLKEARATLKRAAEKGEPLPGWLIPLVTPAGLAHYRQCREEAAQRHQGGLAGFSVCEEQEPSYPPPPRPCICCNVRAWVWTGDRYICSHPDHPKEP